MVEFQLPKLATRVRFPSPAPNGVPRIFQKEFYAIVAGVSVFLTGCATVYYPGPEPLPVSAHQGVYHVVEPAETLWGIAQTYHVDIDQLTWANGIRDSSLIKEGQRLFIPGAPQILSTASAEPDIADEEFSWPLRGRVTRFFGSSGTDIWNKGLCIQASEEEPVKAVRRGEVVFADYLPGYEATVIVEHSDGLLSVYANTNQCRVRAGEQVGRGTIVADARSGRDSFLYFEIRRRGEAVNPLFFLPK